MLLIAEPNARDHDDSRQAERRRGLRVRQRRPIKVFVPAAGRYFGGQTLDISAAGLRIEVPGSAPLREGSMLNIHVGVGEGGGGLANRRRMMPARVVWTTQGSFAGRRLIAGIELSAAVAAHLDAA